MDCKEPTYIISDHFSSCNYYKLEGGIVPKPELIVKNYRCDDFDEDSTSPKETPMVSDCYGESTIGVTDGGIVQEEYIDRTVYWTYRCEDSSWTSTTIYKDTLEGDYVESNCDETTGATTHSIGSPDCKLIVEETQVYMECDGEISGDPYIIPDPYVHPCEGVDCTGSDFCDGSGNCISFPDPPTPYIHPCDNVTVGDCEFCDGEGNVLSVCPGDNCCEPDCIPDCSCAATTLVGDTCDDGCMGLCDGTLVEECEPINLTTSNIQGVGEPLHTLESGNDILNYYSAVTFDLVDSVGDVITTATITNTNGGCVGATLGGAIQIIYADIYPTQCQTIGAGGAGDYTVDFDNTLYCLSAVLLDFDVNGEVLTNITPPLTSSSNVNVPISPTGDQIGPSTVEDSDTVVQFGTVGVDQLQFSAYTMNPNLNATIKDFTAQTCPCV